MPETSCQQANGNLETLYRELFGGEQPGPTATETGQKAHIGEIKYKSPYNSQKAINGSTEPKRAYRSDRRRGEQAEELLQELRSRDDHRQALDLYRQYQQNTRRSETLQTEILKGSKAGEDIGSLFLKAVKAIALMTENGVFYKTVAANMREHYGIAAGQEDPLREPEERPVA